MKIWIIALLIAAPCGIAAQGAPSSNGAYVQDGSQWNKMYLASTSGLKTGGAAKAAFTYGIAKIKSVMIYRDASAAVKVTSHHPQFLLIGSSQTAPRDIVIVRLERKKDHRELQIGTAGAWSGASFQYRPEDVTQVDVREEGDKRYISPKSDLSAGEYVIFTDSPSPMPNGYGGYDFTVPANK